MAESWRRSERAKKVENADSPQRRTSEGGGRESKFRGRRVQMDQPKLGNGLARHSAADCWRRVRSVTLGAHNVNGDFFRENATLQHYII